MSHTKEEEEVGVEPEVGEAEVEEGAHPKTTHLLPEDNSHSEDHGNLEDQEKEDRILIILSPKV